MCVSARARASFSAESPERAYRLVRCRVLTEIAFAFRFHNLILGCGLIFFFI